MKGILKKAAKGWFIWYQFIKEDGVVSGYESLPLFIDELTVFPEDDSHWKDKEIDFEIVRYCPYHKCSPSEPKGCTLDCAHSEVKYAKIIYDVYKEEEESDEPMTLNEAVSILKIHQEWRKGADIVMIEPRELSEAIDMILSYHQIIQKIKI